MQVVVPALEDVDWLVVLTMPLMRARDQVWNSVARLVCLIILITIYLSLVVEFTENILVLEHSNAVAHKEDISQLLRILRDSLKLVKPVLVLKVYLL